MGNIVSITMPVNLAEFIDPSTFICGKIIDKKSTNSREIEKENAKGEGMQAELLSVKLKKTERQENCLNLKDEIEQEKSRNARLRAADIESWYDNIAQFTYPTCFIPLSIQEAQAIVQEYKHLKANPNHDWSENETLRAIQTNLDDQLAERQWDSVFAKLSSRSPKDSRYAQNRAKQIALERLQAIKQEREVTLNDLVIAIMTTGIETLRMDSGRDILMHFLTSDRVCEDDLPLALEFPDRWSQHLIVRKWLSLPIQFEFRSFIVDNKLKGLSQYFIDAYFPELPQARDKILRLVEDLFEKVSPLVGFHPPEYVLDIGVQLEEEKAFVIEINPWGPPSGMGTGTCLFDLRDPHDQNVLFGDLPFEFRLEEQPPNVDPAKFIRGEWKEFFVQHGFVSS